MSAWFAFIIELYGIRNVLMIKTTNPFDNIASSCGTNRSIERKKCNYRENPRISPILPILIYLFILQAVKILDSKRSQNIGILASSLHKDFSEIEHGKFSSFLVLCV